MKLQSVFVDGMGRVYVAKNVGTGAVKRADFVKMQRASYKAPAKRMNIVLKDRSVT